MRIDIKPLAGAETGTELPFASKAAQPKLPDLPKLRDLQVSGIVVQLDDRLLVRGQATATIELQCARCSKDFKQKLIADFSEEFAGKPTDEQFRFDGKSLDLAEMLRVVLLLAVPHRPLHDADCKGLCTVCGKDLNSEPHKHPKPRQASEFDKLKRLSKKL